MLAGPNKEKELRDTIQRGPLGPHLKTIVVAPVLHHDGTRLRHESRSTASLGRDLVWHDGWQGNEQADPTVGDELVDDFVLPLPPPSLELLWEYKVCIEFHRAYSNRPRNWGLRLPNRDPLHPLINACTPLIACTEEDAVAAMISEHCAEWGAFTLDSATLAVLLQHRYRSLLDDSQVITTIAKHVPLRKVVDAQYRRDILKQWKSSFPGKEERLQPRRCDPALRSPSRACAPYKKGWHQWMAHHFGVPPEQPSLGYTPDPLINARPLVLLGAPAVDMTTWARSHGPHVYMQGRLNLALLHDCLADKEARYLVLDHIPWPLLLAERTHGRSILINGTFSWFHGYRLQTTTQRLPVIVLNSHLPNPNDARWAPHGWLHWKSILHIVKLLPEVPLLEPTADKLGGQRGGVCDGLYEEKPEAKHTEKPITAAVALATITADARHESSEETYAGVLPFLSESFPDADASAETERARVTTPVSHRRRQHTLAKIEAMEARARHASCAVDKSTSVACHRVLDVGKRRSASLEADTSSKKREDVVNAAARPCVKVRTRSQSKVEAGPLAPLKLDLSARVPYGPDSFLYPNAIPVAHRQRLLHVVQAIEYLQMKFRGFDLARQKAFQSDNIAGSYAFYQYTGSVPDAWFGGDWSPEMLELRDALREATGEMVNSMVANQYLDRDATIGHHSDKTPDIQRGTSIFTVSLGATRVCELLKLDGSGKLTALLTDGCVFENWPVDQRRLHPQHPDDDRGGRSALRIDIPQARLSMDAR